MRAADIERVTAPRPNGRCRSASLDRVSPQHQFQECPAAGHLRDHRRGTVLARCPLGLRCSLPTRTEATAPPRATAATVDKTLRVLRAEELRERVDEASYRYLRGSTRWIVRRFVASVKYAIDHNETVHLTHAESDGSTAVLLVDPIRLGGGSLTAYDHHAEQVRTSPSLESPASWRFRSAPESSGTRQFLHRNGHRPEILRNRYDTYTRPGRYCESAIAKHEGLGDILGVVPVRCARVSRQREPRQSRESDIGCATYASLQHPSHHTGTSRLRHRIMNLLGFQKPAHPGPGLILMFDAAPNSIADSADSCRQI